MNTNEQRLQQALRALSLSETRSPSAQLEIRLLERVRPRGLRPLWQAGAAALAAAILLSFYLSPVRVAPIPPHVSLLSAQPQSHAAEPVLERIPKQVRRRAKPQPIRKVLPLMRIPYTEPLGEMDRAEVVRVTMPAAQLLYWGFPFPGTDPNSDVNADLLVGEDGLARAVRVVP